MGRFLVSSTVALLTAAVGCCWLWGDFSRRASSRPDSGNSVVGLNLPRTQYDTNQGNFRMGAFDYSLYTPDYFALLKKDGLNGIRLGFNVQTGNDADKVKEMVSIVQTFLFSQTPPGKRAVSAEGVVLCMWDTCLSPLCADRKVDPTSHGDGLPNKDEDGSYTSLIRAWHNVRVAFESAQIYPKYEIFNEPFGFSAAEAADYVKLMKMFAMESGMMPSQMIIDGTGYADNVVAVAEHWPELVAWHIYPGWVPAEKATAEAYKQEVLEKIPKEIASRTYITEFGADLEVPESYEQEFPIGKEGYQDVNMLLGLQQGLTKLAQSWNPVAGTFSWHGFTDRDSYAYLRTDGKNSFGLSRVQELQIAAGTLPALEVGGPGGREDIISV